jgi:hypothetical protein
MYAFAANVAYGGPAIRLHAAKPLRPGDAVTITYGEHSSTHFALYYGFVPHLNPYDSLGVTISDVLSTLPEETLGPAPEEGWQNKIDALVGLYTPFQLYVAGPSRPLFDALSTLLPSTSDGGTAHTLSCDGHLVPARRVRRDPAYQPESAVLAARRPCRIRYDGVVST